ncbi:MAG: MBL fold metallo-hydrolase [Chloroflexota bacterium]
MIAKGLTVGQLQENCYIIGCEKTNQGAIIDPGDNADAILAAVKEMDLTIAKIINTHAHLDHVLAINDVKAATGASFFLHEADLPTLENVAKSARLWLGIDVDPICQPDEYLEHGQKLSVGEITLEVRFTPGHAPGHVIFVQHESRLVFAGDTLFQGSIGRFDLPGADGPTLLRSIEEQLMSLPDDYAVYPGHGGATQIGIEREHNPYLNPQ